MPCQVGTESLVWISVILGLLVTCRNLAGKVTFMYCLSQFHFKYVLSLLFGPCRLLEFTLTGPLYMSTMFVQGEYCMRSFWLTNKVKLVQERLRAEFSEHSPKLMKVT